MRLDGKVAIVTGGASGFGRTTAVRFAEEGARVVVVDLDRTGSAETVALVDEAGSTGFMVVDDVAAVDTARAAVAAAVERFGGLDVLVNNAGISQSEPPLDTWDADEEVWDRILRVNLKSVYACSRAAIPYLLEGGGSIVNVASIAASVCIGGSAYAASKGAIVSYTRHISRELAARGVRVNCVSPGFMRTPMTTGERDGLTLEEQDARIEAFGQRVPIHHCGSTLDIANAVVYLASDESGYVTGQELVVDGGYIVR